MIRSGLCIFLLITLLGHTTSACSVTLCSDINYVGPCVTYNAAGPLGAGDYPTLNHHKYYSSGYISGSDCVVHFYHERYYTRYHYTMSGAVANFHHIGFNDALGSLKVVHTYCGAGLYFYSSSHTNYGCASCPAGTSKSSGAACSWGSSCSSQCTPCTAGTFSSEGSSTCQGCAVGHHQHMSGQTRCGACAAGTFASVVGSAHCSACQAGTYAQSIGHASCNACPKGTYQNMQGQTGCNACDVGSFAGSEGSASCSNCAIGSYSDVNGASECKLCAPRKRGLTNGATTESEGCGWCPAGTYQSGHGFATCNPCDAGTVSVEGSLECTPCAAGSIPNSASSTCDLCPGGTYQPLDGQTTCIPCPTGSASSQGASECSPCPAGTYPDETSSSCQPCHDNLIGFNNACYGTMDFEECPASADVGECEFQSQDDSFNLLPGCELVEYSDEIVTNVIHPEENRFGAEKIRTGSTLTPTTLSTSAVSSTQPASEAVNLIGYYGNSGACAMNGCTPTFDEIPAAYNVIIMTFLNIDDNHDLKFEISSTAPVQLSNLATEIQNWKQSRDPWGRQKLVLVSLGGQNGHWPSTISDTEVVQKLGDFLRTHNLDGIDIDFEAGEIQFVEKNIEAFRSLKSEGFVLSAAPEAAQAPLTAYRPILKDLDWVHPQFYNNPPNAVTTPFVPSYQDYPDWQTPNDMPWWLVTMDTTAALVDMSANQRGLAIPATTEAAGSYNNWDLNLLAAQIRVGEIRNVATWALGYDKTNSWALANVIAALNNDESSSTTILSSTSTSDARTPISTEDMVGTVSNVTLNATQFDEGKVLIKCHVGNIVPTVSPTVAPSQSPTSEQPTVAPSSSPTTSDPTTSPSLSPSNQPTVAPSQLPTTAQPTGVPSVNPTSNPSGSPTVDPTKTPTFTAPTLSPTFTTSPTQSPSKTPTVAPSIAPSATEVLKVEESDDKNFLIVLFVTIGSVLCCFGLVVFAFFRNRKVAEENAKRTPDRRVINDVENVENMETPKSPVVTAEEALNQTWEIQIEE